MRRRYYVFMAWMLALGGIVPLIAQTTCPAIVETALNEIGDNCGDLERNSACYGYNRVGAAFTVEVEDDFFSRPADTTELAPLAALETAALNIATGEWGVAVMSVQANLPDTLPGQAVTFLLFGDTQLENAGAENTTVTPIEVTVTENINLRSGSGLNRNVVGVASAGDTFSADGISAAGDWLRVAYNDFPAWIRADLVRTEGDFSTLPVISHENPAPMQAFYLTTGIGQSGCQQAPDTLLVQGPENYEIDLTVNGAEIRLGSTVLFRTVDDALEITVIDGKVTILPDEFNSQEIIIPEGFRSAACLAEPIDAGNEGDADDRRVGCAWAEPERTNLSAWCSLEDIPVNVLNYPVNVTCDDALPSNPVPVVNNPQPEAPVTSVPPLTPECQNFQRLAGGERMISQYRWSIVPQADQYKLNLYDSNGSIVASRWFPASVTSADLNLGDFPTGGAFQWEVEALLNGQVLCSTGRSGLTLRPGDTTRPGVAPDLFTARRQCTLFPNVAIVFWENAAPADTLTFITTGIAFDVTIATGTGSSGSSGVGTTSNIGSIKILTSSGRDVTLPGCP
jgi:hypothetical protein